MTLNEVQEQMPDCKIISFVDGMYLALPKNKLTQQYLEERRKRVEECFSIRARKENT